MYTHIQIHAYTHTHIQIASYISLFLITKLKFANTNYKKHSHMLYRGSCCCCLWDRIGFPFSCLPIPNCFPPTLLAPSFVAIEHCNALLLLFFLSFVFFVVVVIVWAKKFLDLWVIPLNAQIGSSGTVSNADEGSGQEASLLTALLSCVFVQT